MPTVLLFLVFGLAEAAPPPPTVVVRPLPAQARKPVPAGASKAEIIAAMSVQTTTAYHPLGAVTLPDGNHVSAPTSFTCVVSEGELTVSYVREGFDTSALPEHGTCGEGEAAVRFRIEVERK